jgi:hypothetical protein
MKAHVLIGTREQILEELAHIEGPIREVVVLVEEPAAAIAPIKGEPEEDIFKEMEPYMTNVDLDSLDLSREAIYAEYPDE